MAKMKPAKKKQTLKKSVPAKKKTAKIAKSAMKAKKASPKKVAPKKALPKTAKTKSVKTKPAKAAAPKANVQKPTAKPVAKAQPTKTVDYTKVVTPLGDRIVVRIIAGERMTAGGLYIPDTAISIEGHVKGEVLAVGTGTLNKKGHKRPLDVTVGDKIYFNGYSATKVNFGTEELHIVKEVDVLGVAQ